MCLCGGAEGLKDVFVCVCVTVREREREALRPVGHNGVNISVSLLVSQWVPPVSASVSVNVNSEERVN